MAKAYRRLAKEGAAQSVPVANGIQTYDATATPQNSPLAYTAADTTIITAPLRAAELIIKPTTDLRVSEDSAMATYAVMDGGSEKVIPIGDSDYIYIKGDTADGTLHFYFHLI